MKVLIDPHYFHSLSPDHQNYLLEASAFYVGQLEKHKADGLSVVAKVMEMVDAEYAENIEAQTSCKNGCNHCCFLQVDVTAPEAKLAFEYAKERGVEIDVAQLEKQAPYASVSGREWVEKLSINDRRCVFLKNGSCSIYKYRPLVCRKYNSVDDPKNCDTTRGAHQVGRFFWWNIEAMTSAVNTIYEDSIGGLSKHLKDLLNAS